VASLSIVIPLHGAAKAFEDTLVAVLQNRPANCEVLVVHAGPYDDPYELASEVVFLEAPPESGLVDRLNLGFRASDAEVIHLLWCGVEVEEGWTEAAHEQFEDPGIAAVAPLVVDATRRRLISAGVRRGLTGWRRPQAVGARLVKYRDRRMVCHAPDTLASFWRKSAWRAADGFDPVLAAPYALLDLALRFSVTGSRCIVEPQCVVAATSAEPITLAASDEGHQAERLYWKHAPHAGWQGSAPLHAAALACETLTSLAMPSRLPRLWGRTSAMLKLIGERLRSARPELQVNASAPLNEVARRRDPASRFPDRGRRAPQHKAIQPY
jgi:hypothetical protein